MATKGKTLRASVKRKQEEVEEIRVLAESAENFQVLRLFTAARRLLLKRSDCCTSLMSYQRNWYWRD